MEESTENGSGGKRKREETTESVEADDTNGDSAPAEHIENGLTKTKGKKFNWRKAVKELLNSAADNEMKVKILRKDITDQYKQSEKRKAHSEDELKVLFDQAIKRLSDRKYLELDGKVVRVANSC